MNKTETKESYQISSRAAERVSELAKRYPHKKSAVMPALYIVQEELGWLPAVAYDWIAEKLDLAPAHVRSVASFYTMYYKQPVGKYHIQICRTLSCMLCGAKDITKHVKQRLGTSAGEVTADGFWSYEEVECLGSCGSAPMVQINDVFFENLTNEKLDAVMDRIQKEKPDLRYSTHKLELGEGMSDSSRSQVWSNK